MENVDICQICGLSLIGRCAAKIGSADASPAGFYQQMLYSNAHIMFDGTEHAAEGQSGSHKGPK